MKHLLLSLFMCFLTLHSFADEGMWLINLLSKSRLEQMQAMGLKLSASDIYNINKACLKDAIVSIDNGCCTGEIISNKSLLLTNYHCAIGDLQKLSSLEHDYLKNGFWAKNHSQEIPIEGKTVSFLHKVEDITDRVEKELANTALKDRNNTFLLRKIYHKIERELNKDKQYELSSHCFLGGSQHLLFYYKTYTDVRLVASPPSCIGAFGGQIDNWRWPQHKGDFTIFRIYADKDGNPASYSSSSSNVPLKPKYVLPISLKGVKNGDFSMILGYPAQTQRNISSYALEYKLDNENIAFINSLKKKLDIIKKEVGEDENLKRKYTAKLFKTENKYSFIVGENKYAKKFNLVDKKKEFEKTLENWIYQDKLRKEKYADILPQLERLYKSIEENAAIINYFKAAIAGGADIMLLSSRILNVYKNTRNKNGVGKELDCRRLNIFKRYAEKYFFSYCETIDKSLFASMMEIYNNNVPISGQSYHINKLLKRFGGDYSKLAEYVYQKSFLSNKESFSDFISKSKFKDIEKDVAVKIYTDLRTNLFKAKELLEKERKQLYFIEKKYLMALAEMKEDNSLYPDANSTMRLSFGKVQGYSPADGVLYQYKTSVDGYIEKHAKGKSEYFIDKRLKGLLKTATFGEYAANGKLNTCFITNNDITKGNSGSPVLNGKGQLIGVAYDGNHESLAGNFVYNPSFNRTICVDIRFVLWVIDKYANASYLIDEMNIVD